MANLNLMRPILKNGKPQHYETNSLKIYHLIPKSLLIKRHIKEKEDLLTTLLKTSL